MRPSPAPLFRIPNFPSPFPRAHYRLCRDYIRQALSPRRLTIHAHMKTTGAAPRQRGITQVLHFLRSASPPRRVGTVRFLREGKMTAPSSVTQRSFPVLRWEGKTKKPHTLSSAQEGENNRADRRASIPRVGRKTRRAGQNIMRCSKLLMGGIREFQNTHAELIDRRR